MNLGQFGYAIRESKIGARSNGNMEQRSLRRDEIITCYDKSDKNPVVYSLYLHNMPVYHVFPYIIPAGIGRTIRPTFHVYAAGDWWPPGTSNMPESAIIGNIVLPEKYFGQQINTNLGAELQSLFWYNKNKLSAIFFDRCLIGTRELLGG